MSGRRGQRRHAPLPLRLLRRWLPENRSEELLGDLHEDFRRRQMKHGSFAARLWAWREALAWKAASWRAGAGRIGSLRHGWRDDLRFAGRLFLRRPGLSVVIVTTLALCIGAGTAVFSVVRGAILDPWPYEGPFRIVTFQGETSTPGRSIRQWSTPEARELIGHPVFEAGLMGARWDVTVTAGEGPPERFRGVRLGASAWSMLGVEPALGRTFTRLEDRPGGEPVVVIGNGLWQRRFGGDPEVVGRQLVLENDPYTVIGVMPPRFRFWGAQVWAPLQLEPAGGDRSDRWLTVQARLPEGISVERAEEELGALADRLEREHGARLPEYRGLRFSLRTLHEGVLGEVQQALLVLTGGVLLVLLVACANIANLLLARTVAREGELGIRAALGAGRLRVLRQLVLETLLVALVAGGLGILLAHLGLPLLMDLVPEGAIPAETVVQVEGWTVAVGVGLSLVAGLLLAGPAVWSALRLDAGAILAGARRGASDSPALGRLRAGLLLAQIVVSMLVVSAAVWLASGYSRLAAVDPGFVLDDRLTLRVELSRAEYESPERITGFYRDFVRQIDTNPGIRRAGLIQSLPLTGASTIDYAAEGVDVPPEAWPTADVNIVGPGAFDALGIPILAGRDFGAQDGFDSSPVALVSQALAERAWPDGPSVGRRIRLESAAWASRAGENEPRLLEPPIDATVVGVVGDVRQESLEDPVRPQVYLPHAQSASSRTGLPMRFMSLVVDSALPLSEVAASVRAELAVLDPELPLIDVRSYDDVVLESVGGKRFTAVLLGLFAALAGTLAGLGVFALTAHGVNSRMREMGIRRALGAGEAELRWLLVRDALVIIGAGVVAGGAAALGSQRLVAGLVYGFEGTALVTVSGVAGTFLALAALAAYLPARRVARLDPGIALRDA